MVAKPAGDGTEELVQSYQNQLDIKLVPQRCGYVIQALNLGLKHAKGDAIAFLDDDAIPAKDWLQIHAQTYQDLNVTAVAGDALPVHLENGKPIPENDPIKPPYSRYQDRLSFKLWDKPLAGTETYFVCITRGGSVSLVGNFAYWRSHGRVVGSFMGQGANMSVLAVAIQGFSFEDCWVSGSRWEQVLAWNLWKAGGRVVFNPKSVVYHMVHGQTLSRDLRPSKARLFQIENELFFYRLYGKEKGLSCLWHVPSVLYRSLAMFKNRDLPRIEGIVLGNLLGLKLLALKRSNNDGLLLADLERLK